VKATVAPTAITCADFSSWPDVDHGITCGGCQALVLTALYGGRCDTYCESFGHACVATAEEMNEDCAIKASYACDTDVGFTSDMLCTCSQVPTSAPTPLPYGATYQPTPEPTKAKECSREDTGVRDNQNQSCDEYRAQWCGHYDDSDFSSTTTCCACTETMSCDDQWATLAPRGCNHRDPSACVTCGNRIEWMVQNRQYTNAAARRKIGMEYPLECGLCLLTPSDAPTPSPTDFSACPWLDGPTSVDDLMLCGDGTYCNVSGHWDCCRDAGRSKCPANRPKMCQSTACGDDYHHNCCEADCNERGGGDRVCEVPTLTLEADTATQNRPGQESSSTPMVLGYVCLAFLVLAVISACACCYIRYFDPPEAGKQQQSSELAPTPISMRTQGSNESCTSSARDLIAPTLLGTEGSLSAKSASQTSSFDIVLDVQGQESQLTNFNESHRRPLPPGKKYHYFMSHKKHHSKLGNTEAIAMQLHDSLEAKGYCGFFDVDNLEEISKRELEESVRQSCVVLVTLTDETCDSEWCCFEWDIAKSNGIPVKGVVDIGNFPKRSVIEKVSATNAHVLQYQLAEYTEKSRKRLIQDLQTWMDKRLSDIDKGVACTFDRVHD